MQEEIAKIQPQLDTNKDGKIQFNEMVDWYLAYRKALNEKKGKEGSS